MIHDVGLWPSGLFGRRTSARAIAEASTAETVGSSEAGSLPLAHPTKYRADIDGLRAISVIGVILFHLSPIHFKGGGLGVDVFFVISGFLIGGIVIASFDGRGFSFRQFYIRRLRRIFPAFVAMLLATFVAAMWLFYPKEMLTYAGSGLAALACAANIFFFFTTDYFTDNSAAPLLHTWTLGVEEQFYFLFPFVALAAYRFSPRRWLRPILIAGLILSLAIAEVQIGANRESAAFFLLPARAWELMAGVVATQFRPALLRRRAVRESAALVGLVLVLGSLALVDPTKNFPGLKAGPACFGAVMLLMAGAAGPSMTGRLLSTGPMRLVGLASYSLYLWHWPVIVFLMHYLILKRFAVPGIIEAATLSFVLGFASWHFIEKPWRSPRVSTAALLKGCGAMAAVLTLAFLSIYVTHGYPQRFPPRALAIDALEMDKAAYTLPKAHCFLIRTDRIETFDTRRCLAVDPIKPNWLLVGDSHAAMLYGGLVRNFPGLHFQAAVTYGCELAIDVRADRTPCNAMMHHIFSDYLPTAPIKGVVIVSRWERIDRPGLIALTKRLAARGVQVVVIGTVPEYSVPIARVLAEAVRRDDPTLPARTLEPKLWTIDAQLEALSREAGFTYISGMRAMCRTHTQCILTNARGLPLYSDGTHYSDEGADAFIARLRAVDATSGEPLAHTMDRPSADSRRLRKGCSPR